MRVALMIEGQEGVTWEQWVALARACEETASRRSSAPTTTSASTRAASATARSTAGRRSPALAAVTTKLRLGSLVSPVTFRHPSVLAKRGRDRRPRLRRPRRARHRRRLDGARARARTASRSPRRPCGWRCSPSRSRSSTASGPRTSFDFDGQPLPTRETATALPKPVQQPHPPLIVGGGGARGTLVPAVRWADEYNTTFPTDEEVVERRRRLLEECDRQGREPLRFSMMTTCIVGADAAEFDERARGVYELGAAAGELRRLAARAAHGRRSSARSTRSSSGCNGSRRSASTASCSSTCATTTSTASR